MKLSVLVVSLGMLGASASAAALDLKGLKDRLGSAQSAEASGQAGDAGLGGLLGGAALPGMDSSVGGNAAGALQYCIRNNYLSADAASGIKDRLLGKVSGQSAQDQGYRQGEQGLLSGSDGKSFDLRSVSDKVKRKACDYVLDSARSMI
ncbi:MAG TPA: DUF2501 domain-containing protein [Xanthomonadaceae bacterium]|nr:DUF2501 domain-containing protein [Xanthomonadaceae bacterium]